MLAIAIHFLGFYIVSALMPSWAAEVDGELASTWYTLFVIVDLIAMSVTRSRCAMAAMALSCAWSACLALETYLLQDFLQSYDYAAQYLLDGLLSVLFAVSAIAWMRNRKLRLT